MVKWKKQLINQKGKMTLSKLINESLTTFGPTNKSTSNYYRKRNYVPLIILRVCD